MPVLCSEGSHSGSADQVTYGLYDQGIGVWSYWQSVQMGSGAHPVLCPVGSGGSFL